MLKEKWKMFRCIGDRKVFCNFAYVRHVTHVTLEQGYRSSGTLPKSKKLFSEKQKKYGYKIEVSIMSLRLAVGCAEHYLGFIADTEIFCQN